MYLDILILISIFTVLLIFFSEVLKLPAFGVLASVFFALMGVWILTDGIQLQNGELVTNTAVTVNQTVTTNEVHTNSYSELPATSYMSLQSFFGMLFLLLAIYEGGVSITRVWGGR